MLIELARIAVRAFGVLICFASLWGLVAPSSLLALVSKVASSPAGFVAAVAIRIVLGAALLTAARDSMFPSVFLVLGWLAILAAIGLLIMGQERMQRLVARVARFSVTTVRAWLVFGLVFGAVLIAAA